MTRKLGHPEFYEGRQRGREGVVFQLTKACGFGDLIITTGVCGINQHQTMFIGFQPEILSGNQLLLYKVHWYVFFSIFKKQWHIQQTQHSNLTRKLRGRRSPSTIQTDEHWRCRALR